MLHIIFGEIDDFNKRYGTDYKILRKVGLHFDTEYEVDWLEDGFARRVIRDIDNSEYREGHIIDSPILGVIPPTWLSGGVKTLLPMKNCNYFEDEPLIFYGNNMGDNCSKYLAELSTMKLTESDNVSQDIWMHLTYYMVFPEDDTPVNVMFEGINIRINTTSKDLYKTMIEVYCEWNEYMEDIIQKEDEELRQQADREGWIFEEIDPYGFRGKFRTKGNPVNKD